MSHSKFHIAETAKGSERAISSKQKMLFAEVVVHSVSDALQSMRGRKET